LFITYAEDYQGTLIKQGKDEIKNKKCSKLYPRGGLPTACWPV